MLEIALRFGPWLIAFFCFRAAWRNVRREL